MNPVIDLMKSHSSVRRFKEEDIKEEDLQAILTAGQMASSWKNFQSYSIILVRSQEKKEALLPIRPSGGDSSMLCFLTVCRRSQPSRKRGSDAYGSIPSRRTR